METHVEAEFCAVVVVGQTEVGSGGSPERARTVGISLVLLEQLQVLQEEDPLADHGHSDLLQVALLCGRERGREGGRERRGVVCIRERERVVKCSRTWCVNRDIISKPSTTGAAIHQGCSKTSR